MRFNASRLATLAGITSEYSSERRSLNEAGNQSRHDEGHDEGYDFYKGDLNEVEDLVPNPFGESEADDKDAMAALDAMGELDTPVDEMVEINENMLRREIARMRQERSQRANKTSSRLDEESRLRNAIRQEIGSITAEMRDDLYTTRNWLYGDNKPQNSKKGYVARGGLSIGFK